MHLVPLRIGVGTIYGPFRDGIRLRLIHQVSDPRGDWLNQNLRPLALQKFKHVEVAVAFRELGPEFSGDFDHGFDTRAIHFDRVQLVARRLQGIEIILTPPMLVPFPKSIDRVAQNLVALELGFCPVRGALFDLKCLAILQVLAQSVDRLAKNPVGLSLPYLERTNLVDKIVNHVPEVQRIQHSETEIDRELQPRFSGFGLDSIAVFEQQDAEPVEARVLKGEPVFRLIHAETAGAAGTGRKEHVVVKNLLARDSFSLEELEVLHQIADGEIGGIALPIVPEFFPDLKSRHVWHRQLLTTVTATLKHRANQVFMLPGKPAE